jgi:hypothetical protein
LSAITLPAVAGTDMAPSPSGKDMKDMKQVTQACQSDSGFYVAALGGANFDTWAGDNRQTFSTPGGTTFATNARLRSDWGAVGGAKVGYNFNSWQPGFMNLRLQPALEAEGLYIGDTERANFFGGSEKLSTNSGDFFLNGILRFKNSSIVTPYVGVGAGLQYITTHGGITTPGGQLTGLDTSDLDFAGQALVGFDIQVASHISLFSEYKFIDAIGTDGKASDVGGTTYRFKPDQMQQNLVTAGVKYTF